MEILFISQKNIKDTKASYCMVALVVIMEKIDNSISFHASEVLSLLYLFSYLRSPIFLVGLSDTDLHA